MIGILLVFITAALSGEYFSKLYSVRCRLLRSIGNMLGKTALMIRYSALPVEDIISRLASDSSLEYLDFLGNVCSELENGGDFRVIWRENLDIWHKNYPYDEEYELLAEYGRYLGTTDPEGQLDCLGSEKRKAEEFISRAEEERRTKGKLCRSMGVLIGIGAALVLL